MDDAALLTLAATQHGVISDAQAIEHGLSAEMIRRRIRAGEWQRVLPRVLRRAGAPTSGRQAAMAACLWAGSDAVISHATAGVLWALDGIATRRVEITVPARRGLRSNLVTVHRSLIDLTAERCDIEGIAVTSATRTLLDLAGALSAAHARTRDGGRVPPRPELAKSPRAALRRGRARPSGRSAPAPARCSRSRSGRAQHRQRRRSPARATPSAVAVSAHRPSASRGARRSDDPRRLRVPGASARHRVRQPALAHRPRESSTTTPNAATCSAPRSGNSSP